ncbi:MAG TPA: hypothetical protein VH280_12530 [Verrucomicrobiae bacterium]|nr:hypothetical protein [Verrucomicrobiae bacterium]
MESESNPDMRDVFESLCTKSLHFLVADFAFKIVSTEKDNLGCFIVFQNDTTALKASMCPLDGRIAFDFYRLVNNIMPKYPIFFDAASDLLVFNFDNVTLLKDGTFVQQRQSDLFSPQGIERIVKEYADLLRRYATDLLRGDFSISEQVKQLISLRSKRLKNG